MPTNFTELLTPQSADANLQRRINLWRRRRDGYRELAQRCEDDTIRMSLIKHSIAAMRRADELMECDRLSGCTVTIIAVQLLAPNL